MDAVTLAMFALLLMLGSSLLLWSLGTTLRAIASFAPKSAAARGAFASAFQPFAEILKPVLEQAFGPISGFKVTLNDIILVAIRE